MKCKIYPLWESPEDCSRFHKTTAMLMIVEGTDECHPWLDMTQCNAVGSGFQGLEFRLRGLMEIRV